MKRQRKKDDRRVYKRIAKKCFWLFVGVIFTIALVRYELSVRGCFRIGGEWLIVPAILGVKWYMKELRKEKAARRDHKCDTRMY